MQKPNSSEVLGEGRNTTLQEKPALSMTPVHFKGQVYTLRVVVDEASDDERPLGATGVDDIDDLLDAAGISLDLDDKWVLKSARARTRQPRKTKGHRK